ncbi:MAG: DUF4194 domain-containing protein [Succinivibrio sp.]
MTENEYELSSTENELQSEERRVIPVADSDLRNAIINLLKNGSIQYKQSDKEYRLLIDPANTQYIQEYLSVINIELVINHENGLAFTRNLIREQAEEIDDTISSTEDRYLIGQTVLTPFKAIVILILRKFYQERLNKGEDKIVVNIDYMKNSLIPYLKASGSDSKDSKKLNGVLKELCEYHLLKKLKSAESDRYEIMPLIRYVIDVEKMIELLKAFRTLNGNESDSLGEDSDEQ